MMYESKLTLFAARDGGPVDACEMKRVWHFEPQGAK